MTASSFFKLAEYQPSKKPEYAEWVNPAELDSPAARTLTDPKASTKAKRQAAAELLAAPFYLVYHVDLVNAPMALEVKELKRGTVGARAIRFDKAGNAVCARVFYWRNDKAKSDKAIEKSNKALIDPAVAQELREDLRFEMLKRVGVLALPQEEQAEMDDKPPDGISN
jgi:hypothetical protein